MMGYWLWVAFLLRLPKFVPSIALLSFVFLMFCVQVRLVPVTMFENTKVERRHPPKQVDENSHKDDTPV